MYTASSMELPEYEVAPRPINKSSSCTIQKLEFSSPLPSSQSTAILKTRCRPNFAQCQTEKRIYEKLRPFQDLYPCLYQIKVEEEKRMMVFVVEHCEGGDLQTWVESGKGVNREQAYTLLVEVSKSLKQLHLLGIAHNQPDPSNVLLSNGHFKLGGFGSATELSYTSNRCNPQSEPNHNPPEFCEDVFTLAATFLTYFAEDCGLSIKEANERERFGLVDKYLEGFEGSWKITLKDMLRSDPNQRISAAQAYENFASQANRSIRLSVAPSVVPSESLNHAEMGRLIHRAEVSSSTTSSQHSMPYIGAFNSEISTDRVSQDNITHSFMVAFEPIIVLLQHSSLDESLLKTKITAVMGLLEQHKGAVELNLTTSYLECNNSVCHRRLPAYQMCSLGTCQHVFCKDCLNQEIVRELKAQKGLPTFRCFVDSTVLDVFSAAISPYIYREVMADIRLRQITLSLVYCPNPKCREAYDASTLVGPSTVHCRGCNKRFCSYCLKLKRHLFRCSKWAKDQKKLGQ